MILVSFLVIAKNSSFRNLDRLTKINEPLPVASISVFVSGSVKKPVVITVPQGTSIRKVLRKARVQAMADLTNIDLDRSLQSSCSLHIPTLEKITVVVQGAIEESISIELPPGSRICDLKNCLKLSADADLGFFRHRKILKNTEIIDVPFKNRNKVLTHLE